MPEAKQGLIPVPHWVGVTALICSGFAGLVYEATWARYLKQILGHESYAQALVIGIFLGGLAIGAALAGRRVHKWQSPLVIYAVIEAILALLAIQFHDIFVAVRAALESGTLGSNSEMRWLLAVALILPQSILLGATFPMLTAALARSHKRHSGGTISLMYFANSLGGVFGALAVAFVLVELAGLPGAMLFGAIGSAVAALLAWIAHHRYAFSTTPLVSKPVIGFAQPPAQLALAAFGVGLAALVLEIVWIRKLALILGSSTRAFELILAAFILGLALGSLLAERFADRAERKSLLARVLLLMGVLGVVSIFTYEHLFFLYAHINLALPRDDTGYLLSGLSGFGLALLLMVGPTICSGMTLPLLTREAIDRSGERALGSIYAWNSLGSIIGVALASQLLLPMLGLKLASGVGAMIAAGLAFMFFKTQQGRSWQLGLGASLALIALVGLQAPYDQGLLSSGPYRTSEPSLMAYSGKSPKMVFHKHGRTASIVVEEDGTGLARWIKTNGKAEGNLPIEISSEEGQTKVTGDFITTMMLGAAPLMYHPEARRVAMVGIGTGFTAATLLASENIERLYALEIEAAVIEAGEHFPVAAALYEDPRATIEVIDAKVYFTGLEEKLDIIVSEPSNPWVSGVSSLFTVEHFEAMHKALADDGILVQWFHTYESSPEAMVTIIQALNEVFPDYIIYLGGNADLIVLASPDPMRIAKLAPNAFTANPKLTERLKLLNLDSPAAFASQAFADKIFMDPYIQSKATASNIPANSDYFPMLDTLASKDFFYDHVNPITDAVYEYGRIYHGNELPHRVFRSSYQPDEIITTSNIYVEQQTTALQSVHTKLTLPELFEVLAERQALDFEQLSTVFDPDCDIETDLKFNRMSYLIRRADFFANYLLPQERMHMWQRLNEEVACINGWRDNEHADRLWRFHNAFFVEDYPTAVAIGNELLPPGVLVDDPTEVSILLKVMLSEYAQGNYEQVVANGLRLGRGSNPINKEAVFLLVAHALAAADSEG